MHFEPCQPQTADYRIMNDGPAVVLAPDGAGAPERKVMTRDEILKIPGHEPPVLCADGKVGLLTVFPGTSTQCGVQVHGEPEHRWMECSDLRRGPNGALCQAGAPDAPAAGGDMLQEILRMSWLRGLK